MAELGFVLLLLNSFLVLSNGFECGVRKVKIKKLILRGQDTSPGDWPWHVAVYHRDGTFADMYACGGTLIDKIFVLTARHCVQDETEQVLNARNVFVRLGLHNLQKLGQKGFQQHDVRKIHVFDDSTVLRNDIAILELDTEARFDDYVQPACINLVEDLTKQMGTAVGWGFTETDTLSPVLKASLMPVISVIKCLESDRDTFGSALDSSHFCAGFTNGTTVCNGDSGGGIHFERNGVFYIGGLVSFTAKRESSDACRIKSYAAFTDVYHFREWIGDVTKLRYLSEDKGITVAQNQQPGYLPRNCGPYLINRIRLGTRAQLNEFPWMAVLIGEQPTTGDLFVVCPGTVINKRYVLTSASRTYESKPVIARLGEYDFEDPVCNGRNDNNCAPPVQDFRIERIIEHPEYDDDSFRNNIALIRLRKEVKFEDHIQPICLPVSQTLRQRKPSRLIATGWGHTWYPDGVPASVLHKATIPVIDFKECRSYHEPKWYIREGVLCAGRSGTPGTCFGDAGGPLGAPVQDNGLRFVQFGILSVYWCGNGTSIYTNVAYYMDWIMDTIRS